ncbi:hypothetical protein MMC07_009044 [Pseudocyphellaria aurata]|nr:hypothetical protein [Pseudocyphellaria aurata]
MSTPTNEFRKLNLGVMPETRSQTQQGQRRGGRTSAGRGRGRGRGGHAPQAPPDAPVQGYSGLLYSTKNLSPGSSQRATEGLSSEFFVDRLHRHESTRGSYYAFQLKKPVSVRIHNPAIGEDNVECTCEEYRRTRFVCVHIYWLFDGLNAVLTDISKSSPRSIGQGDVVTKISGLYDLIGERLGSLPEQLNMIRGDEIDSDSDNGATEETYSPSDLKSRKEVVQDILSVFDRHALPEEYALAFPDDTSTTAFSEKSFVPGNLAATIYGIAIRDEVFYQRLRRVVTRDICAVSYFSKQRNRARESMRRLDHYVAKGPSNAPESSDVDVPECARTLRLIVHQVCRDRDARASKGPLGAATIKKVVETLVEILTEVVCKRNEDVYENITWERHVHEEHRRDRNLYTYLIGDRPTSDFSTPPGMGDNFIIDHLRDFPVLQWRHLLERLTTILDHIHENAPEGERGSMAFAEKLETLLREYTSDAFEPSSSSVQRRRPTLSSPPASQRRRVD